MKKERFDTVTHEQPPEFAAIDDILPETEETSHCNTPGGEIVSRYNMPGGELECTNLIDEEGNPAGGTVVGGGLGINWQHGPAGSDRSCINGAFVEDVLQAIIVRMHFYQHSKFSCEENEEAIYFLQAALDAMLLRRARREMRGVLGKNEV